MFNDLINEIRLGFNSKQQEIIDGIQGKIKDIVEQVDDGMSTYVVQQDDETSYLIINSEGDYSLLPPFFELEDEAIHQDWGNLVQTVPIQVKDDIELISLIPVDIDYQFPTGNTQLTNPIEMDKVLMVMAEEFFNVYIESTIDFAKIRTAKQLVSFQSTIQSIAKENDLDLQDVLQDASIAKALYKYFHLNMKT